MPKNDWNVVMLEGRSFMDLYSPQEQIILNTNPKHAMTHRLRPFSTVLFGEELFFVVVRENRVQGIANFIQFQGRFDLSYVSVDSACRDQGVATALMQAASRYLRSKGQFNLRVSDYSDEGKKFLKKVILREFSRAKKPVAGTSYPVM